MRNLLRTGLLMAALASTLLVSQPAAQNPSPIGVITSAGRRALPVTMVGGQEFAALDDISAFLPLTVREDRPTGGLTIGFRGRTIVASQERSLVSVDGRVVALPAPLTKVGSRWLAPVDFVPRALGLISDQRIDYRRASRLLVIGNARVPRVTSRIESAGPPSRLTIELSPSAPVTVEVLDDRVLLRVDSDAIDLGTLSGASPLVSQVRAGDQPNSIAVMLSPAAGEARATTATADNVTRVTVDVAGPPQADVADTPAPARPAPPPPVLVPAKSGLQTIVIDPGHGGDDAGVRGAGGSEEKQVTLEIARRLKALLESRLGVHVLLTRDDDRAVSLDQRTAIANNGKGDLFISLHMNGSPSTATTGAEVLYMRLDRDGDEARRVAGAQALALPVLGGGTRVIETIRWDLAQARHVDDSGKLADILSSALQRTLPMGPSPTQVAPLRVLAGLNMPAVLVEMGYLTNAEQEKQFTSDDVRTALAQAVYEGINQFAAFMEGR